MAYIHFARIACRGQPKKTPTNGVGATLSRLIGHGLLLLDDEALMPKLLSRVSSGQHPTGWAA